MVTITKSGAPNRKTKGAIGDIYIDSATGNKYKCTFSYYDMNGFVYEWKPIAVPVEKDTAGTKEVKNTDPVVSVKEEPAVENPQNQNDQRNNQQRKNYHGQYNKQNNR